MIKKIIILTGDPNSINSEIIFKCWKKIDIRLKKKIYFVSNFNLLDKQFKKLKYKINLKRVKKIEETVLNSDFKILDVNLNFKRPFEVTNKASSSFVTNSLILGHKLAKSKNILGLINCPIDKKLLRQKKIGVTEFLASKCNIKDNSEVMLIQNKKFSVSPITTHIDVRDISKKINSTIIIKKIKTIDFFFKKVFKKKPKIGVLGLNPHNAELRKSSEEKKIIIPALKKLKKNRIKIYGPLVSDTLFIKDYKNFDVIVGMYHDQVLTPFKTLYKFDAINISLGLKYLRVSPDHGVGKKLIGKKKADHNSLLNCINFINNFGNEFC